MKLRVVVDHDMCAASGFCARIAPEVFRLRDEDDSAVVLVGEVPTELEADVREAEAACPVGAISVLE